jgi:hypothetical protein
MTVVADTIANFAAQIVRLTTELGRPVIIDEGEVADRGRSLNLKPPGLWSPNRGCRLVRTADGWIAVNLPRETDIASIPAWIGCDIEAKPWPAVLEAARRRACLELVADARLLGLPVCAVGEVHADGLEAPLQRRGGGHDRRGGGEIKVIDLSSMWAGPLCGAVLTAAGWAVTKVESRTRPDATRVASPEMFDRLNGDKMDRSIDLTKANDIEWLRGAIAGADVVVTSARPRAFEQLGLTPARMFSLNPGLTWVAISGYGWLGEQADRVAFGDDAAAAGGLLRRSRDGEPRFLGDALADPLTGLAAAVGALESVQRGGGFLVDAALAVTAAGVAAQVGNRHAAR